MNWRFSIWRSGLRGQRGDSGAAGALVYDSGGLVVSAKIWSGRAVTDANGAWTVDYTVAGFTQAPNVQATVVGHNATVSGARNANLSAPSTTTSATGIVTAASGAVLGLIPLQLVGAGVVVHVTVTGK